MQVPSCRVWSLSSQGALAAPPLLKDARGPPPPPWTQGSDAAGAAAAGAAGGVGAAGSTASLCPNGGTLGTMGERSAYQRLAGGEEGQQVMGIARNLEVRPHLLVLCGPSSALCRGAS